MQLVIVPAPSSSAETPPPSPSPAPTATVGTASPAPLQVEVVEDPRDDVAIAGLVVSAVSIFLAWRAVMIGRAAASVAEKANETASNARAAVALERRRTFELEILRDLAMLLDDDYRNHPPRDLLGIQMFQPESLAFQVGLDANTYPDVRCFRSSRP